MAKLWFNRYLDFGQVIPAEALPDQSEIRHIPQFFRASAEYAYRLGGPAIRKIIDSVPFTAGYKHISVDVRVHMLMPGWMPCIGGWHCDDFYRPTNGQPDMVGLLAQRDKQSRHTTICVGPVAMTEFITTPFEMDVPTEEELAGENLYGRFTREINQRIAAGELRTDRCVSGQLTHFDCFDFHRGMVSEGSGWRMFMRVTESNIWEPKNEIRTQTQVYLQSFEAGW